MPIFDVILKSNFEIRPGSLRVPVENHDGASQRKRMRSFSTLLGIRQIALCPFNLPFLCMLASGTEYRDRITVSG